MDSRSNHYEITYLWFYIINAAFSLSMLWLKIQSIDMPKFQHFIETGICCMGIWMLLSLWGRSFRTSSDFKGKYALDTNITKLFSFALFLIECMVIYYASFNHPDFLRVCFVSLIIWIVGVGIAVITNKRFIIKNSPS